MTAILKITDGTNAIDLLSPTYGAHLNEWKPAMPEWKNGGIRRSSPLADGSALSGRFFENVADVFKLMINGSSQDNAILAERELIEMLESAVAYWTGPKDNTILPVYLEARSPFETNTRYALIHAYKWDDIGGNPYTMPLFNCVSPVMHEVNLAIEHSFWTENPPGTGTAVEVAAQGTYKGATYGRAATTAEEAYIGCRHNDANLTNAYHYDASTTTYSADLIGAALPFALYPAVPANGDILYLGCDSTGANSGPFSSVIFDIGTAAADITTIVLEYWNGAAWTGITDFRDETAQFTLTGVRSLSFEQPSNWATTAVSVTTGYWIRLRITAVGAAPTPPTQQNRGLYTVTWPSVLVDDLQVGGDIPALSRYVFATYGENGPAAGATAEVYRLTLGLRSTSRGADFRAYLNAADEQNPTGITVYVTTLTIGANTRAPSGRAALYNPVGASSGIVAWDFSTAIAPHFSGRFHAYGRVHLNSAVLDCYAHLLLLPTYTVPASYWWKSKDIYPAASANAAFYLLDFGQITLPPWPVRPGFDYTFQIGIEVTNTTGSPNLTVYDLILIPVDEFAIDTYSPTDMGVCEYGQEVDIDSITSPRRRVFADVITKATNVKDHDWNTVGSSPVILQPNREQRIYGMISTLYSSDNDYLAFPQGLGTLQVYRNNRYLGLRGAK